MKRTPYMQLVMDNTYSQVAIIAIQQGSIDGAWEKAISERLQKDYSQGSILPVITLELLGLWYKEPTPDTWVKAAYGIRETHVEEK